MTVIFGVELDDITYINNPIKEAILNNDPIEPKLHVIAVISNPCLFVRRYILMKEFINRIENEETNVLLYIVELVYGDQKYIITDSKHPRHIQIRTKTPLWHKENMVNIGVKKLLPPTWKAMAWIDADIQFENTTWAMDTLKILNGTKDVVQVFSHCVDMDKNESAMNIFSSFGYNYSKQKQYTTNSNINNFWHPGYAWACTRKAYEKMGGLYEWAILGSGDNIMALSFVQKASRSLNRYSTENYKTSVMEFQERVKTLRLGYVPGMIHHSFHGSKKNRRYMDRWQILVKYNYDPTHHIQYDKNGLCIPTEACPPMLLKDISDYFSERNEDEGFVSH
jgi:hypothetical protein